MCEIAVVLLCILGATTTGDQLFERQEAKKRVHEPAMKLSLSYWPFVGEASLVFLGGGVISAKMPVKAIDKVGTKAFLGKDLNLL